MANDNRHFRFYGKYYVGLKEGKRSVFQSTITPTLASHGKLYNATIGPFRTKRGAEYMRDNPFCPDVAAAEKAAKEKK